MNQHMSQTMSVSKASLAAIVTKAGLNEATHGKELSGLDDDSASKIIRVLFGSRSEGLQEILKTGSLKELTASQKGTLQEVIQVAANRLEMSEKPIV
jgi:hypothetical protein